MKKVGWPGEVVIDTLVAAPFSRLGPEKIQSQFYHITCISDDKNNIFLVLIAFRHLG